MYFQGFVIVGREAECGDSLIVLPLSCLVIPYGFKI